METMSYHLTTSWWKQRKLWLQLIVAGLPASVQSADRHLRPLILKRKQLEAKKLVVSPVEVDTLDFRAL